MDAGRLSGGAWMRLTRLGSGAREVISEEMVRRILLRYLWFASFEIDGDYDTFSNMHGYEQGYIVK